MKWEQERKKNDEFFIKNGRYYNIELINMQVKEIHDYTLQLPNPIISLWSLLFPRGVLPYMGYIGMCRCEGYGFQAVYSSIGYINQSVWV